jgi:hypothetical protein
MHFSGEGEGGEEGGEGGEQVGTVAGMQSQTAIGDVVVKESEGALTVAVSADAIRDNVAEHPVDVWVESRRGAGVGPSCRPRCSVSGVFGVPVLNLSQQSCPVDTSSSAVHSRGRGVADREAKKEALMADFERKQAELRALYLTKIQELEQESDVVADVHHSERSDTAYGPHRGKPLDPT